MLEKDKEIFQKKYPDAENYLIGANLRYECYTLFFTTERVRTDWQRKRLIELMKLPDCNEPWFLHLLVESRRKKYTKTNSKGK